jgi:hypothetical protein
MTVHTVLVRIKRSFEQVIASDVSLFGETSGILRVQQDRVVDCGVVCGGWPSFAFGAVARGWNLKFICLKNNEWSNYIHLWFPNSVVLNIDNNFNSSILQQGVAVWFSDIDPPRLLQLWTSGAKIIITQRRARHVVGNQLQMFPIALCHSKCGGVTDGNWTLCVYSNCGLQPDSLTVSSISGRNLLSVLVSLAAGRPCPAPPPVSSSDMPIVLRQRANTFHCNGLLPWAERKVFVTSPSVFSPTMWVRRRFTTRELLHILDVPDPILSILPERHQFNLIYDITFLPLKVVLQIINMMPTDSISRCGREPGKGHMRNKPLSLAGQAFVRFMIQFLVGCFNVYLLLR